MVYLWKKNGAVYNHTSLAAAAQIDGLTKAPDMEVSEADFEAAGGLARLVNGKIVLGKSEAEKQAEENERRIIVLKRNLADTDFIAVKIAEGSATAAEYAEKIAQRQAWRQEINALSA
ncbi:hypothetical protein FACS1894137_19270 [Spirochaetia bacterium]|nr:hypothetical protein FACS1894137_19270 [Spirochaetia bacterium]